MIYARLSYNTQNWHTPSGPEGKSRTPGVHEYDYRFGFEEWLCSPNCYLEDKEGKEFRFAYIQGISKNYRVGDENEVLFLFTINCQLHQRFNVGEIKKWEYVTPEESLWIVNQYPQLIDLMRNQLIQAIGHFQLAINRFDHAVGNHNGLQLFNIKYRRLDYRFNPARKSNINAITSLKRFWLHRR